MIRKHGETKTYTNFGYAITVTINYDKDTISVVERELDGFSPKKFVFVNRTLEYVNGWRNILKSIESAITSASNELSEYRKLKDLDKEKEIGELAHIMHNVITKVSKTKKKK